MKLSDLKSHVIKCSHCVFVKVSHEKELVRENKLQREATRGMENAQKSYDNAEKEIKEYTDYIKDMKRKMKFIERFVF